ncbi:MAG: four helix bundle protein [Parcubacteria group bacterium]|nr:four helix bundle protein [Parcubacteria group bacterium]
MQTFRFLDFIVYQDAKELYKIVVSVTREFPRIHGDLVRQLIRAVLSVSLNIAEGSAKKSDKDFNRFVENALGSVNESVAALDIAFDSKLISADSFRDIKNLAEKIAKQLGGLSKKLKS